MGRRKPYRTLEECLFGAFANSYYANPQDQRQRWAIIEGINRLNSYKWQAVEARKDHKCIRGCTIAAEDIYFKHKIGGGWGDDWKFCAGCMAMILYFKEVEKLPIYMYSHWNMEAKQPVKLEKN